MAVTPGKFPPNSPIAAKSYQTSLAPAVNLTAAVVRVIQVPFSFALERVQVYCRVLAGTVSLLVGIVRPGRAIQAVTLAIGTTVDRFQIAAAITAVMPTRDSAVNGGLPIIVNKAAADNIEFSTPFTINSAAAAGVFYGAVRVQMSSAGVVSTKVITADQNYLSAADALYNVPDVDPGLFDLGTITIAAATGAAFTANTTNLNAAGVVVTYAGAAAGFVNGLDANPAFVSATFVSGDMTNTLASRLVSGVGGLIVLQMTTNGAGALTDGSAEIGYRPYPLNGESSPSGT